MSEKCFSVTQLMMALKKLVVSKTPDRLTVEGEISGFKVYSSGHGYFTFKDSGAQINAMVFAGVLRAMKDELRARIKDGAKMRISGHLDVNISRGTCSFIAMGFAPVGEGELMLRFIELRDRLKAEGLFDESKKRPLPFLPHRVGIVTSEAGAVIHDMCNVMLRRFPNIEIRLYPSRIQGKGAEDEIAAGIRYFNVAADWKADVIIVGRGGGSLEDLWAFNEEVTVRAVAASEIPIVSAVGHQTDFTLCDYAADKRAGTPSIAGEIVVPEKAELVQRITDAEARIANAPENRLALYERRIESASLRLRQNIEGVAIAWERKLNALAQRYVNVTETMVRKSELKVMDLSQRLDGPLNRALADCEKRLASSARALELLNPFSELKRGYSITTSADGRVVRNPGDVKSGETLLTRIEAGTIESVVK